MVSWDLSVASKQVVPGWDAEAARLRRFLDVISHQVASQHDESLQWRNENMTVQQWNDPAAITTEIFNERLRSEDGASLVPGGTSTGVVLGYLGDAKDAFVNCMWSVGGDNEWQFYARQAFYTEDDGSHDGGARPLNEYPASWLASLLSEAAGCVEAIEARIHTMGIFKAVKKARKDARGRVGALNLAPYGIGEVQLPDSISVFPAPSAAHPEGVVLAVNMDIAVNDPADIVEDLLIIDDVLTANPAS